jgi:hypothetical protein
MTHFRFCLWISPADLSSEAFSNLSARLFGGNTDRADHSALEELRRCVSFPLPIHFPLRHPHVAH